MKTAKENRANKIVCKAQGLVVILATVLMSGCVSVATNYTPEAITFSEPPLNTIVKVGLGEALVRQGRLAEHDAIYLPQTIKVRWAYTLRPGYYIKEGESDVGNFYAPSTYGHAGSIVKSAFADQYRAVLVPATEDKICVVTVFGSKACANGTWETRKQAVVSNRYFQQHLVYGGGHNNKINVVYREVSQGLARSAFDHSVEYDLSESMTIGYKGARLEIIEATNEAITYRVLSNFE